MKKPKTVIKGDLKVSGGYRAPVGRKPTPPKVGSGVNKRFDEIKKASHYNQGKFETIEVARDHLTPEEFEGAMKFQVMKYIDRYPHKGTPVKDLLKGDYYMQQLIRTRTERENDKK